MRAARFRSDGIKDANRRECLQGWPRRSKIRSGHANDRVNLAGEINGSTDDVRVAAELALPKGVSQNEDAVSIKAIVFCHQGPAQRGTSPEDFDEIGRDETDLDLHRLATAGIIGGLEGDA